MLLIWKGCRVGVAAVQNNAVDNFLDDLVRLRILPNTPYSSRDSIQATPEQEAKGELGLGERVVGRVGRHDLNWAPTYDWPLDYFEKRRLSWTPYSGNSWTLGDSTEITQVRKQEEDSIKG